MDASTVTRAGAEFVDAVVEPDDAIPPETQIDAFRVQRRLGAGSMGEVYLAQDLTLGRRVALKLVRRRLVSPEGLSRFLEEARVTASFSHPNIVTVHALGEFRGRPYLALEHLDGQSLRERLSAGPLPEREALRVMHAICEGVLEAHERGLVHADLKPSNIVIPRDGRVRIVDFGLARAIGSPGGAASGTRAYMAPERERGALPSPAIDVWSLSVMLWEMIEGHLPSLDRRPEGPEGWKALVRQGLQHDPSLRPGVRAIALAIAALLDPRATSTARSPFRGLEAFTRADHPDFTGRERELDAAIELLRAEPLMVVSGPSGVGKSSFVEAGLGPRLLEAGPWEWVRLRPGAHPLAELAHALGATVSAAALAVTPASLALQLASKPVRTLLFVDQAEEAFTVGANDATAFFTALASVIADDRCRVVLTLRDDFLGRLAAIEPMRRHLGALLVLGPLSRAALEASITRPLARVGYTCDDPRLPARIAADVESQPAGLALLQFACQALWDRRDTGASTLRAADYEAMRGPGGALSMHAEQLVATLAPHEVGWVRHVLLSLINADGTRRPNALSVVLEGLPPQAARVVDTLLSHRLVVARREAERDEPMLEVAHEALAATWPRLAAWLDETHELRALVQQLELAARVWVGRERSDEATWGGTPLLQAAARVDAWKVKLPAEARAFLDAGLAKHRRLERRQRRWVLGAIGLLTALAAGATAVAFEMSEQRRLAIAQQEQIRLAAADLGRFELVLEPFDWNAEGTGTVPAAQQTPWQWSLRAPSIDDPHQPGRTFSAGELNHSAPRRDGNGWKERVEARSGPAFLQIDREGCAPSLVPLQRLPGYTERHEPPLELHIPVPTCEASRAGVIEIPAGPFFRNVDAPGTQDDTVDVEADLAGYGIDRTEVTRGAFNVFGALEPLSGDGAAPAGSLGFEDPGTEALPIVGVSFRTARDYCRFLGKDLPTLDQFQKAVRGGLRIHDTPNPEPKREYPWRGEAAHQANIQGEADGEPGLAKVGHMPLDVSPWGVMDLAGNVSEWTLARAADESKMRGLRIVAGANWDTPAELSFLEGVSFRSTHPDAFINYALGFRCVRASAQ